MDWIKYIIFGIHYCVSVAIFKSCIFNKYQRLTEREFK